MVEVCSLSAVSDDGDSHGWDDLTPMRKKLLEYLFMRARETKQRTTPPIYLTDISKALDMKMCTLRKTIERLSKINVCRTVETKMGRDGWARFKLSDSIFNLLLQRESEGDLAGMQKTERCRIYQEKEKFFANLNIKEATSDELARLLKTLTVASNAVKETLSSMR